MNYIGLICAAAFVILGPLVGGILSGLDRIITARMQGRIGPPLLQPFYDVSKLLSKRIAPVNRLQVPFLLTSLIFAVTTGVLFFYGSDILLIIFVLTVSDVFLILAAYSAGSPYSVIGAERELILMMSSEPMVIMALVGLYNVAHSFSFWDILNSSMPAILYLPGIYLGILLILVIKMRKSPFDLSTSHHAHQELIMGLTADMGGGALALVEISHWYETVYLYALVFLFFSANIYLAVAGLAVTFFLVILIDNCTARVKWEHTLSVSWIVTLVAGVGNLIPFYLTRGGL